MSDTVSSPDTPRPRRGAGSAWLLLGLAALLALGAYPAYRWNAAQAASERASASDRQRIEALEERVGALRSDQRAQTARLQQAEATNRLLREELIGLGQRAALVEDTVQKLADPDQHAGQALRLDEVELLLAQGQQRLLLTGDLAGAVRLYALAAHVLDGVADPASLDLRQALAQERAALVALGEDPGTLAARRLAGFADTLPALPQRAAPVSTQAWWERAVSRLVQVQPTADAVAVEPADRAAGLAALQLEFGLARAAIERRDEGAYRAALDRIEGWLLRLWPDTAPRARQRAALQALRDQTLVIQLPVLGSTLTQLRRQRGG
ncbi:uroporphyrinogen-III C-methyltransferase [Luteimonas sp. SDU82]|uniref:uroporphyrinogen-III C-methyltransferase n=1 Tax=Luteimonas sp. SDU82 TaxID=3422592 RepID=UPI003EB69BF9